MEIYTLRNGQADELLYALTGQQLNELTIAFEHFYKSTGIRIDIYRDTKFSSGNEGLIKSISETLESSSKTKAEIINILCEHEKVIFVGD